MNRSSENNEPRIGLGLTAVVTGAIAMGLFAVPVLGIPMAATGLLCGIAGLAVALLGGLPLRWPLLGVLVAGSALGLGIAIEKATSSFVPAPAPAVSEIPIGLPYAAPPARLGV